MLMRFCPKSLGEKEFERANRVAENGIFLAGVGYVLFVDWHFAVEPFLRARQI